MAENCLKIVGVGAPTVVLKRNDWKLIQYTGRNTAGYKKTILERPDGQGFTNQATSTSISHDADAWVWL